MADDEVSDEAAFTAAMVRVCVCACVPVFALLRLVCLGARVCVCVCCFAFSPAFLKGFIAGGQVKSGAEKRQGEGW